jgi:hypothetical protein
MGKSARLNQTGQNDESMKICLMSLLVMLMLAAKLGKMLV